MFHPTVRVKIYDREVMFGPGLVCLLEHIQQTGSMKKACVEMGMSYSKGWKIVNRAEEGMEIKLLHRQHGGVSGGNCEVSEEGRKLVEKFRKMEAIVITYAEEAFEQYFPEYAMKIADEQGVKVEDVNCIVPETI